MLFRSTRIASVLLALMVAWNVAVAEPTTKQPSKMPRMADGKKPKNFRELRQVLKPLGFDIRRAKCKLANGATQQNDLVYAELENRKLRLDLFLPAKSDKPAPVVVLIHGGGWKNGTREREHTKAIWLANRGYAAAAIEYRLSGEARFPAAIHDGKAAIRWLRENAKKYRLNRKQVFVFGGSAGAHLAALLATAGPNAKLEGYSAKSDATSFVQGAIVVAGPTDTTSERAKSQSRKPGSNYRLFLGGTYDDLPKLYEQASPAYWVNGKTPPVLIFGENSLDSAKYFVERMNKAGAQCETCLLTGTLHGSWHWQPWFDITMGRADKFMRAAIEGK